MSKSFDEKSEKSNSFEWKAVSRDTDESADINFIPEVPLPNIDFAAKNLEHGNFANENLRDANFSVSDLTGVDFSGADLRGVDFSGANLTDANLSNADLTGAILSGATLLRTNFTKAKLSGAILTEAYLEDAILLDIEIDDIGIEELQALIEYMAKYYPHKLNLAKINLTLLDISKIDLREVSLRGVDFTGVDFTGVNIMELDLSECIITPEQIAQALGRVPSADELKKILAPKKKKNKNFNGVDMSNLFLDDGRQFGLIDTINHKGISIEALLNVGKKVFRHSPEPPPVKEENIVEHIKTEQRSKENIEAKNHNKELRELLEKRRDEERKNRSEKKKEVQNMAEKDSIALVSARQRGRE